MDSEGAALAVQWYVIQYKCAELTRKRSAALVVSDATLSMMRNKVLVTAVCWLTLTKTWADAKKASIQLHDSVGQETVSRLYRNIPFGVYASASPYAAFSFNVPTFVTSPRINQLGPVKQESAIVENTQGFLRDSYGNRFVNSPQSLAYRTTFPQQYVQLQELPAHLAQPLVSATPNFHYKQSTPHFFGPSQFNVQNLQAASPPTANRYAFNQPQAFTGSIKTLAPIQQQQHPTSNQAVYANTHDTGKFQNLKNLGKSQRLQESPHVKKSTGPSHESQQHEKAQLKAAASTSSANSEKKVVINLDTKPPVPLLDLSLLEPLTFANPLVPQVQHFLPRISSVKYHKLPQINANEGKKKMKQFVIQSTKSYDSGIVKGKPKTDSPRKTQTRPEADGDDHHEPSPPSPTGTQENVSNEEPEIVYEINSPNYKETYKEKVVRYNKETQTEPVHYNYENKSEKEPVTYNFVHTSKEPIQVKNVYYESDGQKPKHFIYKFKPEKNNKDQSENHHSEESNSKHPSNESNQDNISSHKVEQAHEKENHHHHHHERPEHREEEYHHNSGKSVPNNFYHNEPQSYNPVKSVQSDEHNINYQPIITEYEEEIRVLPIPKQYASIKVNPDQHIRHGPVASNPNIHEHHNQPHEQSRNRPDTYLRNQQHPQQQVQDKPQQVITNEETPEKVHSNTEQLNEEVPEQDEETEEHFEEAYKNAAFGFPAFESSSRDPEKEIYNPDTYGRTQYHTDFDIEHSPFQQYQVEGDEYPKSLRSNYKDARDKTKEEYYLDYAISKPESILARYKQKEDYYKMFKKRKPQFLYSEDENDKKNQKQSAKYIAFPVFEYHGSAQKPKQHFAKYKATSQPQVLEYDYSKEAPKDNSAHATRPYQRSKTHTQFVEPQFQYGFEPSTLPRLLDSELAAMASNDSPESEKPGMRKKIFKEYWSIEKTRATRNADS